MDLSGNWRFQIDPQGSGVYEQWFNRTLEQQIQLPGSMQAQGYGNDITINTPWIGNVIDRDWYTADRYAPYREKDNIKVPCWLQPDKHYNGVAWYQRDIEIPADWSGKRVTLLLERPHWGTQVWIDNIEIGEHNALATPHSYDLGRELAPGKHTLTIRVDNSMIVEVGVNAHSVSDHTQTNWNGIVGRIELSAGSPVYVINSEIYPSISDKSIKVKLRLGNSTGENVKASLKLSAELYNVAGSHAPAAQSSEVEIASEGSEVELSYALGDEAQLWDEFHPALYKLNVELSSNGEVDSYSSSFGLREVSTIGTQIAINQRPIFLRGTLDCAAFPLTGFPPTDVESWKRIVRVCQAHGLNHIRFHSWCPPEAAFVAADELGFYYQVECSSWANQGSGVGEGRTLDTWLYEEGERIVQNYGNHPSFILMTYGNEPGGKFVEYLTEWVKYWKERDPRHLHTSGAGWPAIDENDFHNIPKPRIQGWGQQLKSRINALPPETLTDYSSFVTEYNKAIVSHEIGQWCVYPNFAEIDKYTGVLKAKNYEIFRDFLNNNHMGDQAHDFLMASGKLQALCYKEEIESAIRTPGFAGLQLLGLYDFPGQGTALVGVLDAFWEEKGYISPAEFKRFCNDVVPLARLTKRYWKQNEQFSADIDLANYSAGELQAQADWKLIASDGSVALSGSLESVAAPTGGITRLGSIEVSLDGLAAAAQYKLEVSIAGSDYVNDWDLWVFAAEVASSAPADVYICEQLDEAALARLSAGGKVVLMPKAKDLKVVSEIGFSSVFWNTAWTKGFAEEPRPNGQAPHTLGILCDPQHPALASFPTEYHSNWQWWELIHGATAITLDGLPSELRPIVQPIDTWFNAHRLSLAFEAKVNGGSLVVVSSDLQSNLDERLVARQFRHSLLNYVASDAFAPKVEISLEQLQSIFVS
jgi:hypothetical protein